MKIQLPGCMSISNLTTSRCEKFSWGKHLSWQARWHRLPPQGLMICHSCLNQCRFCILATHFRFVAFLSVSPARSDLSFSVLLLFFSPSSQVGCGFCVRPPLASCGWWAVTLIAFLLWSLPKTHRPSRALQTVLTQFYTGPLCEEISWARSFHLVSLWLVSVHHSLSAKVIMLKALLTFIFIQNL